MVRTKAENISSSILPILPNEIILEIFARLPAKSLLRLRCILNVDDELSNYIDTPAFQLKHAFHVLNNPTNELLMLRTRGHIIHKITPYASPSSCSRQSHCITETYDLKQLFKDVLSTKTTSIDSELIGASNGLICLYFHLYSMKLIMTRRAYLKRPKYNTFGCTRHKRNRCDNRAFYGKQDEKIYRRDSINQHIILWNPCTEEYHILPNTQLTQTFHLHMFSNGNAQKTVCGFGYDVAKTTYKVVIGKGSMTQFYDISTNSWKIIDAIDINWSNRVNKFDHEFGEYLNGALHWIVSNTEIIAIELSIEVSNRLKLPYCCSTPKNKFNLGVLKGCLVLSCYESTDEVNIWVMKEYGRLESWTNLLIAKFDPRVFDISPPLWVSKDEDMLLFVNYDMLAYWFPKGEKLRCFKDDEFGHISRGIVHVDTLVSPNPELYRLEKDEDNNKALVFK